MSVPHFTLVRSKLLIPSPANLLHRPQICEAIKQGLDRKLVIVAAPAGYGKTSVLVDFAQHSPVPVCWYTTDERDRDLGTFIQYLIGAVDERFPGFGESTQVALSTHYSDLLHDPTSITGELANDLLAIEEDFVIVVDNYESLDGTLGIRAFIHRLLEILPPNCHLMLGSRVLPDVPVTQLVAKQQLVGLTACDLCFTPKEIKTLLKLSQIDISEAMAQALVVNAEGWITGVLLLADLLRQQVKVDLLDKERATVETYTYLAQEVLTRQPPDIQHFLRVSSVLREMSVRLCREILQIREPRALLKETERRNLFITRFGEGNTANYRYHNLFRNFLQDQLRQRKPHYHAEIHRRAAKWFEQQHAIEEAIYHYLAAQDYPDATALMERVAMEWFTRGRVETLLHWAEELPRAMRAQAPRLALYQSRVLTDRYDYQKARQALAHAEAGFAARQDKDSLAKVHNQRATLGLFEGRYEDAVAEAQTALEMLNQNEIVERANAQRLKGLAFVKAGLIDKGITQLRDALELFRKVGSHYDIANLLQDIAHAAISLGQLGQAEINLSEALAIRRRLGGGVPLAGVLNNLGYLHYLRGEYQQALALYEEGLAAARHGSDQRYRAYISAGIADLYRDVGAYERALPMYNAGWQMAQKSEPGLAIYILIAQANMHRWQQNPAQAMSLLAQARRLAEEKELNFEKHGLIPVAEGIALAESGEFEEGLRLLSEGIRFLAQRGARHELARAQFLLAKAHLRAGNTPEAVATLRQALALGEQIGTHQLAIVEGSYAEELLELGLDEEVEACHVIIEGIQQLENFKGRGEGVFSRPDERQTHHLEIYMLGKGEVLQDGRLITASEWQTTTAKELFFYILLHGPLRRDAIGVEFWPDLPSKKLSNRFHITLHRVRGALGADVIVVRNGEYRLGDVDYWLDMEEFEESIRRARLLPPHDWQTETLWQRAESLYQGDFLPEAEQLWCVHKREELRDMYVESLIGIGQCHEVRLEYQEAVNWYKKALEIDELREDIHRHIMQCYTKAGRQAEALAQYHHCREILSEQLGTEPGAETTALYERITQEEPM